MRKSNLVYWIHFLIVSMAHVAALALPISLMWFIVGLDAPWQLKTTISCVAFYVSVLGVNHVTSKDSICCLTTLENYYHQKEGSKTKGEYIPRYYSKIRSIFSRRKK
jgi:hypothetical protein